MLDRCARLLGAHPKAAAEHPIRRAALLRAEFANAVMRQARSSALASHELPIIDRLRFVSIAESVHAITHHPRVHDVIVHDEKPAPSPTLTSPRPANHLLTLSSQASTASRACCSAVAKSSSSGVSSHHQAPAWNQREPRPITRPITDPVTNERLNAACDRPEAPRPGGVPEISAHRIDSAYEDALPRPQRDPPF
jgi:hypothetical protein